MRKNETHKPHQSLIRSSSSSKEEEEEDNKNTRQREEEDNERRRLLLILPLMVLLSAELMVDCFWCVSRGVRGVCYKKLSKFSHKEQKKHKN